MHSKWPDHYADLYGCISDDTFEIVKINNFNNDIPREELWNIILIAAIVKANEGFLITNNVREFKRIKDLKIENRI